MSVPVNKETFDGILAQFLDAANRKPGTFTLDRAHSLSEQVKTLASTDSTTEEVEGARKELVAAIIRGHENGAYGISDSGLAYKLVTFYSSGALQEKK